MNNAVQTSSASLPARANEVSKICTNYSTQCHQIGLFDDMTTQSSAQCFALSGPRS